MPYVFHDFAALTPAQAGQVTAMENDPNNPKPIGMANTESLFGYVDQATGNVVAWAWGDVTGPQGDLHLIVEAAHQHGGLGKRLALRYFLRANPRMADYVFAVTNPLLVPRAIAFGFVQDPNDPQVYSRPHFAGQALIDVEHEAHESGALARVVP
jgi:hypothetical protein